MTLKSQKSSSQSRFDLFTKMQLFLKMVDKRARLAAEYLGVNPTSICGYDNRLSMNEVQFKKYLETPEAKAAFETGCLGEPTPDSKAFTDTITNDQILPVLGCEVPEPLRNVCCAQWFHSHKSKKNCQHNTVGGIWWREKYADEYNRIKYICTLELATLDKYINENYETAEEREILRPYYAHNITEKVRESIASD
jgi:COMPASS component SPP1